MNSREEFLLLLHGTLSAGLPPEQAVLAAMDAWTQFVDACEEFEVSDK